MDSGETDVKPQANGSQPSSRPASSPAISSPVAFLKRMVTASSGKSSPGRPSTSKARTPPPTLTPSGSSQEVDGAELARSYENVQPLSSSTANLKDDVIRNTADGVGSSGATSSSTAPISALLKTKLIALEKLKKLGLNKAGKGDKKKDVEFPPASWNIPPNGGTGLKAPVPPTKDESTGGLEINVSPPTLGLEPIGATVESTNTPKKETQVGAPPATPEGERVEPTTIAHRVQVLLSSMPRVSFSAASPSEKPVPAPLPESNNTNANIISDSNASPPPFPEPNPTSAALTDDSKLISQLSSTSTMNGSVSKGRESVWAILDRLGLSRSSSSPTAVRKDKEVEEEKGKEATAPAGNGEDVPGSDDVMLYTPLEPDDASIVEIARSEVVEVSDAGGGTTGSVTETTSGSMVILQQKSENAVDKGKGKAVEEPKKGKQGKEKIVWLPSASKISVQATWWGYRIFLPPPVLRVLNSKSMEAAKRATLITTALKWLLDHIPTAFLPPQVRPAAKLLKRLVPLLGYIGAFIAWSWGAIRTFDRGNGVILSATWLLPLALIPGSWDENDFPKANDGPPPPPDQLSQQPK